MICNALYDILINWPLQGLGGKGRSAETVSLCRGCGEGYV
jgi:hypothetical protein